LCIGIFIYLYAGYWLGVSVAETTTIRVSKKTAETLERLREKLGAESLDEAIQVLIKKQRKAVLERTFGADRNRVKPFSEADRGEDRN
jgi:predicted CopG family antitoxin